MTDNPRLTIPEKLLPFFTKKKTFKVAFGGRMGCKSQSIGDMLIVKSQIEGAKVGCFREYQNTIEDSVHALLVEEIQRIQAPGYTWDKTHIDNNRGGGFRFRGLTRSPGGVKSMQGFKYFWTEEAQFMSKDSLETLTKTLRVPGAEYWFSLNPLSSADAISQRFIEPFRAELETYGYYEDDLHLIIKVNYDDNPWFYDIPELDRQREHDFLNLPRAEYDHIWLGAYNDSVEGSIILPEWFDAAIDAHIKLGFKPLGKKVCSHDPSDTGPDDKGVVVRHGSVITHADFLTTGDAGDGIDWAIQTAKDHKVNFFNWDCDGLGVSLKRDVARAFDGTSIKWAMFKGSEGVHQPDEYYEDDKILDKNQRLTLKEVYKNRRSQHYGMLKDRFWNTYRAVVKGEYIDPHKMISISSDIKCLIKLKSEICRIPRKHNTNGLFQIMSKEDMKRLKIASPNLADPTMMSLFIPEELMGRETMTASQAAELAAKYARPVS